MRYISFLKNRFSKPDFPVFKVSDVKLAFAEKGIKKSYLYLMLHNLESQGTIKRITRGTYTFHEDVAVVGFAFYPFYYGLESALTILGISEQGTNLVVVTPRNVRTGVRKFRTRNYLIQRIKSEYLFGYSIVKHSNFWVPISDLEKTVIDMIYFKDHIRDELWPAIIKALDRKKLDTYLQKYKKDFRDKVKNTIKEAKGKN